MKTVLLLVAGWAGFNLAALVAIAILMATDKEKSKPPEQESLADQWSTRL